MEQQHVMLKADSLSSSDSDSEDSSPSDSDSGSVSSFSGSSSDSVADHRRCSILPPRRRPQSLTPRAEGGRRDNSQSISRSSRRRVERDRSPPPLTRDRSDNYHRREDCEREQEQDRHRHPPPSKNRLL